MSHNTSFVSFLFKIKSAGNNMEFINRATCSALKIVAVAARQAF